MIGLDGIKTTAEVLILAGVIYAFIRFLQETRGSAVLKGFVMLILVLTVSFFTVVDWFGLYHLRHLADRSIAIFVTGLVVLFQPELRQALVKLGENRFMRVLTQSAGERGVMDEVVIAARRMARKGVGAIIIIERSVGIAAFTEKGVEIDARVSASLLTTIFHKNSPLHDGAVVIRDQRIAAAGCVLPLSENEKLSKTLGTRHRAALGITEESDAIAVVVSEETSRMSVARGGELLLDVGLEQLKEILEASESVDEKAAKETTR